MASRCEIVVVYRIPGNAPAWLFHCAQEGDRNGVLEYADGLRAESVTLTHDSDHCTCDGRR